MIEELRMGKVNFESDRSDAMPTTTKVKVSLEDGVSCRKEWTFTRYFIIGRRKSADVCIKDPRVSRLHTVVFYKEGKWWIQDLKSSNGTIVNGKRILQSRRYRLCHATQLRLSNVGPQIRLSLEDIDPEANKIDLINLKCDDTDKTQVQDPPTEKEQDPVPPTEVASFSNFIIKKWWKYLIVATPVIVVGLSMIGYGYLTDGYMSASGKKDLPVRQSHTGQDVIGVDNGKPSSEMSADGMEMNRTKGIRLEPDRDPSGDKMLMSYSPDASNTDIDQNYLP